MRVRLLAGLLCIFAAGGCSNEQETLREYQLVLMVKSRAAAEAALKSEEGRQLLGLFQADAVPGRCGRMIWVPKVAFVSTAVAADAAPKLVQAGLFDEKSLTEGSQNLIQAWFRQRPAFFELDTSARKQLADFKLPEEMQDAATPLEERDAREDAARFTGSLGVRFVLDAKAKPKPEPLPRKEATSEEETKLPAEPIVVSDVPSLQRRMHELFCKPPAHARSTAVPTAVVIGAGSSLNTAGGASQANGSGAVEAGSKTAAKNAGERPAGAPQPSGPATAAQRAFDRAMGLVHQNKVDLAVKEFSAAIQEYPMYAAAFSNRGVAQLRMKNYGRAADDLRKAVELEPNNPVWHYNLAAYHSLRQESDRGLDSLERALQLGFAKSDNAQIDVLKLGASGDPDLAFLRKRRSEYCAVLERNQQVCR